MTTSLILIMLLVCRVKRIIAPNVKMAPVYVKHVTISFIVTTKVNAKHVNHLVVTALNLLINVQAVRVIVTTLTVTITNAKNAYHRVPLVPALLSANLALRIIIWMERNVSLMLTLPAQLRVLPAH